MTKRIASSRILVGGTPGSAASAELVRHLAQLESVVADHNGAPVFATDAADALLRLGQIRPDLILVDVRMPDMDGVELTRRLKATKNLADIPTVMMTGDARRETLMNSIEAGAIGFVVKPLSRAALEAKLASLLGH